jgi:hypothetical protein
MGKRELLLLVAFLAFGAVVYQVTAPAPDPSKEGFSISKFVGQVKAELKGENVETVVNATTSADAPSGEGRLLIPDYRGTLTILGEDRHDISAELKAVVYGIDEDQAKVRAKDVAVTFDSKGDDLSAEVTMPGDVRRRPRLELTLRIPAHLGVTLELRGGQADLRRVGRIRLDNSRGKLTMADVGEVEGEFENGSLEVVHAEAVTLKLQRAQTRIEEIAGKLTLDAIHGELHIQQVHGPSSLTLERLDCEIDAVHGPMTIEPQRVNLSVRNVSAPLTVKGEHSEVLVTLVDAVAVTIETTDDQIDLRPPRQGVTIDASTEGGQIRVADRSSSDSRSDMGHGDSTSEASQAERAERPEPPEPPQPPARPEPIERDEKTDGTRVDKHKAEKDKSDKNRDAQATVEKAKEEAARDEQAAKDEKNRAKERLDRLTARSEKHDDSGNESRTQHTLLKLHGGGPTITLRNARADIVIR